MQSLTSLELQDPEWLTLLKTEVASGRTITEVAAEVGLSRPALSTLVSGKYPARLDKIERKFAAIILAKYKAQVFCPHVQAGIPGELCRTHANTPMTTSRPEKLRQWLACRDCPQNPNIDTENTNRRPK
ncbi:helix-turn-helix domain-containing protein [Oceaniglobus trochenteri]|uniref:helix-turn-helix domain-containing protein n=1 Tax=Oceaniglobus trochenteri TaxID=2763260 RepID=UPI001D00006D|nr:helix-turn-helix transcriptional regulator [Oceaniglobus trochenteri]